jgi:hypothetical protein
MANLLRRIRVELPITTSHGTSPMEWHSSFSQPAYRIECCVVEGSSGHANVDRLAP